MPKVALPECVDVDRQCQHLDVLLETARRKLQEIRQMLKNPAYIQSELQRKRVAFDDKLTELLEGLSELRDS